MLLLSWALLLSNSCLFATVSYTARLTFQVSRDWRQGLFSKPFSPLRMTLPKPQFTASLKGASVNTISCSLNR